MTPYATRVNIAAPPGQRKSRRRTGERGKSAGTRRLSFLSLATLAIAFCVFLSIVFSGPLHAEPPGQEQSIRKLVIELDREYRRLYKDLEKLDGFVHGFPGMMLYVSVTNTDSGLNVVSMEVRDEEIPLESHIYTRLENEAMAAGGRHRFYKGELSEGRHKLKVTYLWSEGGGAPQKGETVVFITVRQARDYFLELSLERKGKNVELRPRKVDFESK